MKKKTHVPGSVPNAHVQVGSADDTAFLRMAEELGRLVGRFLAEETTKRPDGTSRKRPASKKK